MVTMSDQPGQQQETEEFLGRWKEKEDAIELDISRLASPDPETHEDANQLKDSFESVFTALFDLDSMLSKAAAALPPFVQRKLTTTIKQLRARAVQVRSDRLPRQPFAFSNPESIVLATDPLSQGIRIVGAEGEGEKVAQVDELSREDHVDENMGTLSNLTGETKTLGPAELQDRAWMISDLEGCTIHLFGEIPTLFLHRLKNCNVVAGPVAGATFGESMQDCSLQLATHQLRLHSSSNVLVHVRAGSSPIIEDCTTVGFGRLTQLMYSGFEDACAAAHLPDSEHWKHVQDFLHPGSSKTSNWYLINV